MTVESRIAALRQRVEADGTADISVRELLEWFGAKRRGTKVVERVTAALESAGLRVGEALVRAGSDDVLRFRRDGVAEVIGSGVPGLDESGAPVRRSPSEGSGDLVADLLQLAGAPLSSTPHLIEEIMGATGWIEVAPDVRRSSGLILGHGAAPMPWMRFEAGTASIYEWERRGPLWYSSPVTLSVDGGTYVGAVVFCRDGWWAPDWSADAVDFTYVFHSWDDWTAHRIERLQDGDGRQRTALVLEGSKGRVRLSHGTGELPPWSSTSLEFADAVLRRVLPVVVRDLSSETLGHPEIELWDRARLRVLFEMTDAAAMHAPQEESPPTEPPFTEDGDGASDDALASAEARDAIRLGPSFPDGITDALRSDNALLQRLSLEGRRMGGDAVAALPNRVLTVEACEAIAARIRRDKVVPVWVPPEVVEHFEPFHKWNKVCWVIPWVVLANGMNGPVCVELQGLSVPDESGCFQLGLDIDAVTEIPDLEMHAFTPIPNPFADDDSRWREWTFTMREEEGAITLFEYQPDPTIGFHLDIAAAIFDVQWPVVERSRDSPIVVHLPEDPTWRSFARLEDVVAWGFEGTD